MSKTGKKPSISPPSISRAEKMPLESVVHPLRSSAISWKRRFSPFLVLLGPLIETKPIIFPTLTSSTLRRKMEPNGSPALVYALLSNIRAESMVRTVKIPMKNIVIEKEEYWEQSTPDYYMDITAHRFAHFRRITMNRYLRNRLIDTKVFGIASPALNLGLIGAMCESKLEKLKQIGGRGESNPSQDILSSNWFPIAHRKD